MNIVISYRNIIISKKDTITQPEKQIEKKVASMKIDSAILEYVNASKCCERVNTT